MYIGNVSVGEEEGFICYTLRLVFYVKCQPESNPVTIILSE